MTRRIGYISRTHTVLPPPPHTKFTHFCHGCFHVLRVDRVEPELQCAQTQHDELVGGALVTQVWE